MTDLFPGSPVGLGCMGYSWGYSLPGQLDDTRSIADIRASYEAGVRHFDTSDMYGSGHNEELLGTALAGLDDIVVATKGGIVVDSVDPVSMHVNGSPDHIISAVDASLRRLHRDHIPLYYLHRPDPAVPIEETVQALADAKAAGKIGAIGLSEVPADLAERAASVTTVSAIQSELSVWTRDPLGRPDAPAADAISVSNWCAGHGALFVAFAPLGRGYLTGTLDTTALHSSDFRTWMPRFTEDAQERNRAIVDALTSVADDHASTPSQVALAWVLTQGDHVRAIPGSRSPQHVAENLAASDLMLTDEELRRIDALPLPTEPRY